MSESNSGTSCTVPVEVERRHSSTLTYHAFLREYVVANRPVVVENAIPDWPALRKWTPEFFKSHFGSKRVDISHREQMAFDEFIDAVLASREDAPGPYMYRVFIGSHLPELLPDVLPQNPYAFPRRLASPLMPKAWRRPDGWLKLLIGGVGGRFPAMHYDLENAHAAITEIYGDKLFVLYPPEDTRYLYPITVLPNKSLIPNIDNVDLGQFPLFKRATRHQTVLHPGDMVFVPSRWWHTARVLTPSISVCQNMLDDSNWAGFAAEVSASGEPQSGPRRYAKKAGLTALGATLKVLEKFPRSRNAPVKSLSARVARLAPLNSEEAQPPSTWPMQEWAIPI